ncbi:MAG: hypothetical protein RL463_717, partial [Bacteroidota bacterium]
WADISDTVIDGNNFYITGGYFSAFDDSHYEAIICDECLDDKIKRGIVFSPVKRTRCQND